MYVKKIKNITIALVSLVIIGFFATGCGSNLPPDERPIPSEFDPSQREQHRLLILDGAHNFRDLGGYQDNGRKNRKMGCVVSFRQAVRIER